MDDKLGILINAILNVEQKDLQTQLDSVAEKIKINLKPRIDFDENVIAKFKSDVDKLAKNIKLNLRFDVDKQSVKDAEKTVTETAKKISEKSKSQNKIKVFDKEQLEAEGRQFFISATRIVNRVKNQFKDLGDVNVNFLKNAKNQIIGFEAEIKRLDGIIEKLRFDKAKIKVGDSKKEGFVFSGANLIDKNAGDVLQRNLNTLQKFETRLKNIRDSFTSSRGVKEANNLAILNKEYNSILSTIEKLRKSHSNLTEEQKRNIDKQINNLNSLYKSYRDIGIIVNKNAVAEERKLNTLQNFEIRLNNIRDFYTSSRGVKDSENLNVLNEKYNTILSTIEKLKNSSNELTDENKRNIKELLAELDSTAKKFRDIEITAEKGFNFKQYQEVSDGFNKIKTAQEGFNTSLLKNHKLVRASVQETEQYLKINQELQKGNWIKDVGVYVDKATGKMYQFQNAQRNIMVDTLTWSKAITTALKRMAQWAISGTVIFGTLRQIKAGISYITELDNSLNEIRIVTNKTQQEVNNLALSYNKLAKEMNVTTREIASTAADLFRQGLDDSQVEERMKAIIQYAKISGISLEESNKIITATANATGESVRKIVDIFAMLGDITASGAEEIGEALQKVASTAENSGVSLEKAASWIKFSPLSQQWLSEKLAFIGKKPIGRSIPRIRLVLI